jgi:hypothetical protein
MRLFQSYVGYYIPALLRNFLDKMQQFAFSGSVPRNRCKLSLFPPERGLEKLGFLLESF